MFTNLLFKLNLQNFAEGEDGGEGAQNPETTPTSVQTEDKKLIDKYTKEISRLKNELKNRQTAEEQALEAQKEKDDELNELRNYRRQSELAANLREKGIPSAEVDGIAKAILEGDVSVIAEAVGGTYTRGTDALNKEIANLRLQSTETPAGGSTSGVKNPTIEDFKSMTMDEKIALKHSNPTLYETLRKQSK